MNTSDVAAEIQPTPAAQRPPRLRWLRGSIAVLLLADGALAYYTFFPGALLLLRLTQRSSSTSPVGLSVVEQVLDATNSSGLPLRIYRPHHPTGRTIVLIHGVHHQGSADPRLIAAARLLAGLGHPVVTPLTSLATLQVEARAISEIQATVLWTIANHELVPSDGRVGLVGICIGGGIALVAAQQTPLAERLAYVASIGGHADLEAAMAQMLLPGADPYATAIVALALADQIVSHDHSSTLQQAIREWVRTGQRPQGGFATEVEQVLSSIATHDQAQLASQLAPALAERPRDPRLSPRHGSAPAVPIYLLHAASDRVVPPSHSVQLAHLWAMQQRTELLVSPLFDHLSPHRGDVGEMLKLAAFLSRLLRE
jgi:pimeloyl-ACP methyl ester carboxylesterase